MKLMFDLGFENKSCVYLFEGNVEKCAKWENKISILPPLNEMLDNYHLQLPISGNSK